MSLYLQLMADAINGVDRTQPSPYGWLITRDHLAEHPSDASRSDVGASGPSNLSDEMEAELQGGKGRPFRMYDDDGEHYYDGLILGEFEGFEPLDDYGRGNAGCTDIRYHEDGKWVSL